MTVGSAASSSGDQESRLSRNSVGELATRPQERDGEADIHTVKAASICGRLKNGCSRTEGRAMSETPFVEVASERAAFEEVFEFSHTYDGYRIHGGFDGAVRFCDGVREAHAAGESLESFDLDVLRTALFMAHRAWRHSSDGPEDDSQYRYERALVEAIRAVSGGLVEDHRPIDI